MHRVLHRSDAYNSPERTVIQLHPEILSTDGKPQFAVIPWAEFLKLQELLEDAADLELLREARAATEGESGVSLEKLKTRLDSR